jgi:4-amino-4-deoxy-L-arabinose transferase-like glycosyltransferase
MRRRVPAAAWLCALVAVLNAASWSFVTPPFQAVDEPDHVAYVKQLAETGKKPTGSAGNLYGPEEALVLNALHYSSVRLRPSNGTISSETEQRKLEAVLRNERVPAKPETSNAGTATSEPPLYYALESVPYTLDLGGTLLERLQLMRLLSALLAGLTALFTYLFLRECLPRTRWCWTVGTLGVALGPVFGLMSGAVNPDALLYAVSAAIFCCLARAFRRGLTTRLAIATGAAIAIGFATKLSFLGLAPGAFLALALLATRGWGESGPRGARPAAIAAAIGALPALGYVGVRLVFSRHPFAFATAASNDLHGSLLHRLNYIWQLYLPRLPGTRNDFPGLSTARQIWFDGYVGKFGWLDTAFPGWVYSLALVLALPIAGLCLWSLIAARARLLARAGELVSYAAMAIGTMVLLGISSYIVYPNKLAEYGQIRYLFPLLPLLAAMFALAARGAGRRWGPVVGTLLVVLLFAHDIFSQLQTIARYYG